MPEIYPNVVPLQNPPVTTPVAETPPVTPVPEPVVNTIPPMVERKSDATPKADPVKTNITDINLSPDNPNQVTAPVPSPSATPQPSLVTTPSNDTAKPVRINGVNYTREEAEVKAREYAQSLLKDPAKLITDYAFIENKREANVQFTQRAEALRKEKEQIEAERQLIETNKSQHEAYYQSKKKELEDLINSPDPIVTTPAVPLIQQPYTPPATPVNKSYNNDLYLTTEEKEAMRLSELQTEREAEKAQIEERIARAVKSNMAKARLEDLNAMNDYQTRLAEEQQAKIIADQTRIDQNLKQVQVETTKLKFNNEVSELTQRFPELQTSEPFNILYNKVIEQNDQTVKPEDRLKILAIRKCLIESMNDDFRIPATDIYTLNRNSFNFSVAPLTPPPATQSQNLNNSYNLVATPDVSRNDGRVDKRFANRDEALQASGF